MVAQFPDMAQGSPLEQVTHVNKAGTIRVEVFDEEWVQLANELLQAGDFVVLFRGGHSVTVVSAARFIEVKQGPFPEHGVAKLFRGPEILPFASTEGD